MNKMLILLILFVIIVSGCLSNPFKQVPVVKVNITYVETGGKVAVENLTVTQGTVDYAARPQVTQARSFPAIGARIVTSKGKNSSIGPWEMVLYKGNGTYSFNVGFKEGAEISNNDNVSVYIYLLDKKGDRLSLVTRDIVWKS